MFNIQFISLNNSSETPESLFVPLKSQGEYFSNFRFDHDLDVIKKTWQHCFLYY